MCRKTKLLCMIVCAVGAGFLLSTLISSWFIRLLVGIAFIIFGLIISNHH